MKNTNKNAVSSQYTKKIKTCVDFSMFTNKILARLLMQLDEESLLSVSRCCKNMRFLSRDNSIVLKVFDGPTSPYWKRIDFSVAKNFREYRRLCRCYKIYEEMMSNWTFYLIPLNLYLADTEELKILAMWLATMKMNYHCDQYILDRNGTGFMITIRIPIRNITSATKDHGITTVNFYHCDESSLPAMILKLKNKEAPLINSLDLSLINALWSDQKFSKDFKDLHRSIVDYEPARKYTERNPKIKSIQYMPCLAVPNETSFIIDVIDIGLRDKKPTYLLGYLDHWMDLFYSIDPGLSEVITNNNDQSWFLDAPGLIRARYRPPCNAKDHFLARFTKGRFNGIQNNIENVCQNYKYTECKCIS